MKEQVHVAEVGMKLQGYLLGYEVLQNGVIVQKHRYPRPVKNLVVNTGKAALLYFGPLSTQYNAQSYARLFGYSTATESGVLAYCGRGSGNTAAAVTDTALQTQIGNLTNSFLTGDPNTGTRYDKENGKIIMRVTHDHEQESSDQNINEIGYFAKRNSVNRLFSRIVLPSTISVLTGQQLRTIYQLEVSIAPWTAATNSPSITGWTTAGQHRLEGYMPATSTTFGSVANSFLPTINTSGADVPPYNATTSANAPGVLLGGLGDSSAIDPPTNASLQPWCGAVCMRGSSYSFNTLGDVLSLPNASATVFCAGYGTESSGTVSVQVGSIAVDQTYRDTTWIFQPNWTGYSSITIYAITMNGYTHIFDTPVTKSDTQRLTLVRRVSIT